MSAGVPEPSPDASAPEPALTVDEPEPVGSDETGQALLAAGADAVETGPGDPVVVARRFLSAVAWGEHHTIWELLGREGRTAVLRVATTRGMDEALAARLRDGVASPGDQDVFLTDLVNGLRADLVGTDLDALEIEPEPGPEEDGRARVLLVAPVASSLGVPGLPVGSVELADDDGRWLVQRLVPRIKR